MSQNARSARITGLILALLLMAVVPAFAQGTLAPQPFFLGLDTNGNPIVSGKLCTYIAGTATPEPTYTTSALTVANANPVILNAAGRATVFLRPGTSYKFVLYTAGSDTTCNTGTLVWSQDNILGVPTSDVSVVVTGTAGESLPINQVVYLSDGSGGRTAGSWYLADADLSYASLTPEIGMTPAAIASGASGSILIHGVLTSASGLTPGVKYYVSATAGSLTSTAPTNPRLVGQATTTTLLVVTPNPAQPALRPNPCGGRLTLTTNVPVTTADVTAAGTVYFTPYLSNQCALYDGTHWMPRSFAQVSIAVPSSVNAAYDVFMYDNATVPTLELIAWTNLTTRNVALTLQDGALVSSGNPSRRYLGSFRSTGVASQTEDSDVKRYVWNYYNRVNRSLKKFTASNSWVYTTSTWRQAEALGTNQVEVFVGLNEDAIQITLKGAANNATVPCALGIAIGLDSTSAVAANSDGGTGYVTVTNTPAFLEATWSGLPGLGHHTFVWLERSEATGATTWYGENQPTGFGEHHGLLGIVKG